MHRTIQISPPSEVSQKLCNEFAALETVSWRFAFKKHWHSGFERLSVDILFIITAGLLIFWLKQISVHQRKPLI